MGDVAEFAVHAVEEAAYHYHAVVGAGLESAEGCDFIVGRELSDGFLEVDEGAVGYGRVGRAWTSGGGVAPCQVAYAGEEG